MIVTLGELHLQLDAREERRGWMKDQLVRPRLELVDERRDATVSVGDARGDEPLGDEELDGDPGRRLPRARD